VRETMHNPIVMPDIYSGQSKFRDWLVQFEVCKDINNWTDTQACKFLAVMLRGNALQTFTDIDEDHRNDYTSVVQTLRDRFDPDVDPGVYWAQLRNRVRKRGEPLSELASSIMRLVALAHPQADSHTRSGLSIRYFIEAIDDREIKLQLRRSKPVDMTQALKIALDEESYQELDKDSKVCSISDSENFFSELEKQKRIIESLEEQLAAFEKRYSEAPQSTPNAQGAGTNGEYLQIAGTCEINLSIGSCVYPHKVLIANIAEKAILGNDFLRQNRVVIDLSRNKLKIGTNTVQLYCDEGSFQCCKVTAARNFVIPPESEVVVEGLMHRRGSPFCEGVVESVSQLRQNHPQLMAAKTLVDCELSRKVPVRLLNVTSEPAIVQEGSRIGMLYPVQNEIHSVPSNETNVSTNKDEVSDSFLDLINRTRGNVPTDKEQVVEDLLLKNKQVFVGPDEKLGRCNLYEHEIETGSALPIKQRAYRLPVHKREEVDKQVESMLEQGIVSPSLSPWASPIVLVEKKHDTHKSYRFCVDYRKLNKVTKVDAYPLPRIDDTIDVLSGSQYFSTLDLASGFWQMGLSEKAKEKTAFTTGYGLYHFNVLPFGLCNAPSSFERLMERVLSGLHWKICLIYIDDIIIYSQTFDQHMDRIQQVLDCLHEAGLKLKPQKCHLFKTEVLYLGFIVNNAGVKTDPDKIERIRSWPTPCNITDVRSFLGLCCYYRKFVDNFSDIAVPLYNLTKKNTRFHWDKQCQEAFNTLKVALQESVILQYPQFDQPFILDTDSSDHSSGAILSQLHEGEEKVISYYSTTHSAPERKYSVTRKELLAVIKAIKHFRHYLYGREFVLRTDHASLRWLMGFKEPQGQIARWLEFLSSYQFTIEHRVGSKHLNADALSRIPVCSTITFDQFGWKLSDDVLYRKWFDPATNETRKLLIVPPEMRNEILTLAHDSTTGGHFGIKKTRDKIRQIFYWLGMRTDVTDWIKTCTMCQTRKSPVPKFRAPLVNIQSSEPMEIVAIDITGPFPVTSRDNKYILVVGDLYSKWIESYPIPDQEAKTVAQVLTYKFFTRFGVPKQLHSDQGGNFESKLFKELCSLLGINKTRTTAYRPESDGMIERFNRTMKNILSKYVQADQSDWDLHLPTVTMAYRSSIHETTGVTPNFMMLGREINTPLNIMVELPSDLPKTSVEFVAKMQEKFQSSFDLVRNQVSTQQRRQKLNYDKKISGKAFHVGDKVWLYVPRSAKGLSPKLTRFWTGPFDIIQKLSDVNYVISQPDSRKKQVVHFNRLKPCFLREQSGDTSIDKSLNGNLSADMGESVETDVLPEYEMEN
ncbi:hypothetical protein ScPMuIL_015925, partial [Solemya velum]